jgi:SAM-dependent methyltransferase
MNSEEKKYADLHKEIFTRFTGQSLTPHVHEIKSLIDKFECKSVLDYGCGNALEYLSNKVHETLWGVSAVWYDPNHPTHNHLPDKRFDAVVCTDVMEHIPESAVKDVLFRIFKRAGKFVFFNISTRSAMKTLPNGENAHVTVKPGEWWDQQIEDCNIDGVEVIVRYEG